MDSLIKTTEEIEKISEELKENNKIIVTTNGSFDIIHSAHINLLKKAKEEGDILIVLLNSDDSIKRFKGEKRPIVNQKERAEMLASIKFVDFIVIFNEDDPLELLKKIKPHKHIKGGSFIEDRIKQEKDLIKTWNGELKTFPLEEGFSTTKIIDSIIEKYK